jgi:hypothetical protein
MTHSSEIEARVETEEAPWRSRPVSSAWATSAGLRPDDRRLSEADLFDIGVSSVALYVLKMSIVWAARSRCASPPASRRHGRPQLDDREMIRAELREAGPT